MATLGVTDFKSKLIGGGARPNLFKVTCNFPAGVDGDSELASFLITAANLPGSTLEEIAVPFRGRVYKVAGDRTFEDWEVTVLNDTDFKLRNAFEQWLNLINAHNTNTGATNPSDYQVDLYVEQLGRDGEVLKKVIFRDAFPKTTSAIDLSYETTNEIENFTVNFAVNFWESDTTS